MTVELEMMNEENGRLRRHIKTLEAELRKQDAAQAQAAVEPIRTQTIISPAGIETITATYQLLTPAHTKAMRQALVALNCAEESIGAFTSDEGAGQKDFDNMDTCLAAIAALEGALK